MSLCKFDPARKDPLEPVKEMRRVLPLPPDWADDVEARREKEVLRPRDPLLLAPGPDDDEAKELVEW